MSASWLKCGAYMSKLEERAEMWASGMDGDARIGFLAGAQWLLQRAIATRDNAASSSTDWNNGWLEGKRALIDELEELCK